MITKISPQSVYLFRIKQFTILEFIFYGSSIKFDFQQELRERRNCPKSMQHALPFPAIQTAAFEIQISLKSWSI
jgi:hypothetical protein